MFVFGGGDVLTAAGDNVTSAAAAAIAAAAACEAAEAAAAAATQAAQAATKARKKSRSIKFPHLRWVLRCKGDKPGRMAGGDRTGSSVDDDAAVEVVATAKDVEVSSGELPRGRGIP